MIHLQSLVLIILNHWRNEIALRAEDHPEDQAKRDDDRRDAKNDGDKDLGDEVSFVWGLA